MIKRIDLFMPPISQYGVLHYLTKELFDAFERQGIQCRLLIANKNDPEPFLNSIFNSPPDCTFSLNGLLPDQKGNFFCEMIKIPHIACLVDASPNLYIPLTTSPLNIITCPDVSACHFFQGLNFENVLFMPHGVSPNLSPQSDTKKIYNVVFLGSCIDFEAIRKQWKEKYTPLIANVLDTAQEIAFSNEKISFIEALVQALNEEAVRSQGIDLSEINFFEMLDELEMYIRGKDRIELIRSIKNAHVDVFGAGDDWKKYLGNYPNITVHPPVSYEDALTIMQQSKIVLNSCPTIQNGGHERLFAAMAAGSLVLTNKNFFLTHHFEEGKDLLFYQHHHLEEVNDLIDFYLSHDEKRQEIVAQGRKKVLLSHTWDVRVKELLKQLPPMLERAQQAIKAL